LRRRAGNHWHRPRHEAADEHAENDKESH
jgi:hypothetical protein